MAQPLEQDFPSSPVDSGNVLYTVFVRLPFPRGNFVDPPTVNWDSSKDRELWDLLSKAAAKGGDLDWHATADRLDVTLLFLSQQAAWLYERQLSQVREQLRKVNKPSSIGTSPTPSSICGSGTAGGHVMTRGGSGGSRVPSSLSHQAKERTASHEEASAEIPRLTRGNTMSRTASTNTITQIKDSSTSASPRERQSSFVQRNRSREASRRSIDAFAKQKQHSPERAESPSAITSSSSISSSSSSNAPHPMSRSRAFARRPRYSPPKVPLKSLSDADEEDEDSPPFLPFSAARPVTPPPQMDNAATMKNSPKSLPSHPKSPLSPPKSKVSNVPQTVHSSSSSAQSQPHSQNHRSPQGPLSTLSPRQRRIAKEGSDGTPSMGSSFSDLDDASVTQSALEEALANEMTHGGVASRMSSISQALRSRYL